MENLILDAIRSVSKYALENEAEFIERVREKTELQQEAAVKENRRKLTKSNRRREEISRLIKKLYESYAADKISEKHFSELLTGYLAHRKAVKQKKEAAKEVKPQGKQTVKQLVGQNAGVANIEVTDSNIRSFDRVARKYGIDYAVKKDRSVSPPKYMVFFKARDADALTAALPRRKNISGKPTLTSSTRAKSR